MSKNVKKFRQIIYGSMELTTIGDFKAKIIKLDFIVPDLNPESISFHRKTLLCNNDGVMISDKAKIYHGIQENMLVGAPLAKDILFPPYDFIAVWDGYIANIILKANKVAIKKGSIVDLHRLIRFTKEHASHRIALKKAAIEATQGSLTCDQVDKFLDNPENKVLLLPVIFEYLRNIYKLHHGITDIASLAYLSHQVDKKHYLKALAQTKLQIENKKMQFKKRKAMIESINHKCL